MCFGLKDRQGQERQCAIGSSLDERLHFHCKALAVSFEDKMGPRTTAVMRRVELPSMGPEKVRDV
jgi:hypothetical protein